MNKDLGGFKKNCILQIKRELKVLLKTVFYAKLLVYNQGTKLGDMRRTELKVQMIFIVMEHRTQITCQVFVLQVRTHTEAFLHLNDSVTVQSNKYLVVLRALHHYHCNQLLRNVIYKKSISKHQQEGYLRIINHLLVELRALRKQHLR